MLQVKRSSSCKYSVMVEFQPAMWPATGKLPVMAGKGRSCGLLRVCTRDKSLRRYFINRTTLSDHPKAQQGVQEVHGAGGRLHAPVGAQRGGRSGPPPPPPPR